jgi:threonine dehydratase
VVGVQVPEAELGDWRQFLAELPYQHWEETGNPAYRIFLGPPPPIEAPPAGLVDA